MGQVGRFAIGALACAIGFATPAAGASIVAPASGVTFAKGAGGQIFEVAYTGYLDSVLTPSLTAFGRFQFLGSADGLSWGFKIVELKNSSSMPILGSRLSVYGFDTDPDAASITATGLFSVVREDQNVPGLGTREICIKAANAKSCAGGGGVGLAQGQSVTSGGFNIRLATASNTLTLDNFFVRFQSVALGKKSDLSGVGTGVVTAVPEPGQWAMLIAGFATIGALLRRRRRLVPRVA